MSFMNSKEGSAFDEAHRNILEALRNLEDIKEFVARRPLREARRSFQVRSRNARTELPGIADIFLSKIDPKNPLLLIKNPMIPETFFPCLLRDKENFKSIAANDNLEIPREKFAA